MSEFFKFDPAVFAVDKSYQIMMPCEKAGLFFVKVRDKFYYDESNGIMRSRNEIHRVEVPMDELDEAGEYTVCIRPVIERKPYFTETEEVLEKRYKFCPIPEKGIRAYHISDAHNLIKEPVRAAETFGDIDFLIFHTFICRDKYRNYLSNVPKNCILSPHVFRYVKSFSLIIQYMKCVKKGSQEKRYFEFDFLHENELTNKK